MCQATTDMAANPFYIYKKMGLGNKLFTVSSWIYKLGNWRSVEVQLQLDVRGS